jgi:hypothetical protein
LIIQTLSLSLFLSLCCSLLLFLTIVTTHFNVFPVPSTNPSPFFISPSPTSPAFYLFGLKRATSKDEEAGEDRPIGRTFAKKAIFKPMLFSSTEDRKLGHFKAH